MQAHSNSTCTTLGVCSHLIETSSWGVHTPFCGCYPYYIYYKMGCTTPPGKSNGRSIKGIVIVAKFQNCSSKLCSVFCRFGSISLQQRLSASEQLPAAMVWIGSKWWLCRAQEWSCRLVGPVLIADVTFHDQWHLFQVRHQSYSDCFASLGSHHSSLGNRTGATITGVVARFKTCSSMLFWSFGANSVCARNATLGQLPAAMVWNGGK